MNASPSIGAAQSGDDAILQMPIEKATGRTSRRMLDGVAIEEPLEIQLAYGPSKSRTIRSISVTMRTPGNDFDLAAGFLMTEGVVRDANDVAGIGYAGDSSRRDGVSLQTMGVFKLGAKHNVVRVDLAPDVLVNLGTLERNFYTTSSCGICGKASLVALRTFCPPRVANTFRVDAQLLYGLPERLRAFQGVFDRTGGLHGAGLFDTEGTLIALREDVGRHNAVDKLIGSEFLADRTPLRDRLLLLSGRASFELLQKALMGGISMVAAVGAPSSLAVHVAREFDITLVGFLRERRFNIYHGSHNVHGVTSTGLGAAK
jgi:FdhD protein